MKKLQNFVKKNIFLIGSIFALALFFYPVLSLAQVYDPLVKIPGIAAGAGVEGYLGGIYKFLIGVVGVVAMGAIVIGGAQYMTSAGNTSRAGGAKETITAAIYGLVLALLSWVIVFEINPDILVLKRPNTPFTSGHYSGVAKTLQCALAGGNGTSTAPCSCIDGTNKITDTGASKTQTKITLVLNPTSATVPATINISGKLTDINGASIGAKPFKLNMTSLSFNASRNPVSFNTAADGSFNLTSSPTSCAGTEQWQVVFEGDTAYQSSGSNGVSVTVTGGSSCVLAGYPVQPATSLWSAGSVCNTVCSDTTRASDGKYHCIVVGARAGWIGGNPLTYTDEQLRAFAVNTGTDASPYVTYDGSYYIFEVEKYSTSFYPIVEYTHDTNEDMKCDAPLNHIGWNTSVAVYAAPAGIACKASSQAETCSQMFCIKDSKGNTANTLFYYSILKK